MVVIYSENALMMRTAVHQHSEHMSGLLLVLLLSLFWMLLLVFFFCFCFLRDNSQLSQPEIGRVSGRVYQSKHGVSIEV